MVTATTKTYQTLLPASFKLCKQGDELRAFTWDVKASIYGEEMLVGRFVNFRVKADDTAVLFFDFESLSDYSELLAKDIERNNLRLNVTTEKRPDGHYIILTLEGRLSVPDEPPTTVCSEVSCNKVFPAVNAYKSTKNDRLVCPDCFKRGEKIGTKRLRKGEGDGLSGQSATGFPERRD
jgi:hypothetical protein